MKQPIEESQRKPWDRLNEESEIAFSYFLQYLNQKPEEGPRQTGVVAKAMNKSHGNISHFAKKFNWVERVIEHDVHFQDIRDKNKLIAIKMVEARHARNSGKLQKLLMKPVEIILKEIENNPAFSEAMRMRFTNTMKIEEVFRLIERMTSGYEKMAKLERLSFGAETEISKVRSNVTQTSLVAFANTKDLQVIMSDEKGLQCLEYLAKLTSGIKDDPAYEEDTFNVKLLEGGGDESKK
jgi:hypothetical protein